MRALPVPFFVCGVLLAAWLQAPASAQPAASPALEGVADPSDRTGTNPANLRNTVDLSNRFDAVDDHLFVDQVTWRYAQAFAGRRMRAHVELPLIFGNVTGRTEAGFGDVAAGWEWLTAVRGRVAVLAGAEVSFDSSSNDALAIGHHTASPVVAMVVVPRRDTAISLRYDQRFSLNSVPGRPDVNKGTLEGAIVRRFSAAWWLRGIATFDVDAEASETWGTLRGEWGRMVSPALSTWARAGAGLGASKPMDWTVEFGFRVVP